jgi:hypothetical protein
MRAFERLHDGSNARRPADVVNALVLAANVAETLTVPTNATHCVFASSGDFHAQYFTAAEIADRVVNGTFAADTGWTKGADWTIAAGVASCAAASNTDLSQVAAASAPLIEGQAYLVTFTLTRSAGSIACKLGGGTAGTSRSSAATFSEVIVAGATQAILFDASGFTGTIDDISIIPVASVPLDNAAGSAAELIKAACDENSRTRIVSKAAYISIVSGATNLLTASFYGS